MRASELVLTDLRPWTKYQVLVYAENALGRSEEGDVVTASTYEVHCHRVTNIFRASPKALRNL